MLKNKTIIMVFLLMYCGNVFGMECDPFNMDESYELVRKTGFWTTDEDLSSDEKKFFYFPTVKNHQREDWYQLTKYVAEPWCTVTNLPFLYVAHRFMGQKQVASAALGIAGLASGISHAIPKQWLNVVDRLGAFGAVAGVVYDCNLYNPTTLMSFASNPLRVIPVIAMGLAKYADRNLAHDEYLVCERKKYQTKMHCLWHILAAYVAFTLLAYATR